MTYRPDPVTQRDGSELQNSNCLMAAAATGIDAHTHGAITSSGDAMRDESGDTSGGTNTDEIVRAWASYGESARDRDGHTFDDALDELWDGRGLMLQVWHATTGGPCLSGSGQYGHGMFIAAEQRLDDDGSRQWLVSDPWCKPPSWAWVDQSRLKAGAEDWAQRCAREVGGARAHDIRDLPLVLVKIAARLLMYRWTPGHPAIDDEAGPGIGVGGPGSPGILYASTDEYARWGGSDMAIQAPESLTSDYTLTLPEGTAYFTDSGLSDRIDELKHEYVLPYVGVVVDGPSRAVLLTTSGPYDGDEKKPTVVYVDRDVAEPERID